MGPRFWIIGPQSGAAQPHERAAGARLSLTGADPGGMVGAYRACLFQYRKRRAELHERADRSGGSVAYAPAPFDRPAAAGDAVTASGRSESSQALVVTSSSAKNGLRRRPPSSDNHGAILSLRPCEDGIMR